MGVWGRVFQHVTVSVSSLQGSVDVLAQAEDVAESQVCAFVAFTPCGIGETRWHMIFS